MIMKKYILILLLLPLVAASAWSQEDRSDVRKGNRDYRKENWREAEIDYRKALVKDSMSVAATYNLASTLYREGDPAQAQKVLEGRKDMAAASAGAADYFYNLGDAALANKDYQTAVDAFKESLLLNPGDLNAKENYIYAKKKLEDQQKNQQNQQIRTTRTSRTIRIRKTIRRTIRRRMRTSSLLSSSLRTSLTTISRNSSRSLR